MNTQIHNMSAMYCDIIIKINVLWCDIMIEMYGTFKYYKNIKTCDEKCNMMWDYVWVLCIKTKRKEYLYTTSFTHKKEHILVKNKEQKTIKKERLVE